MHLEPDRSADAGKRERLRIRLQDVAGSTAGLASGNVQANLVILPQVLAHDFLRFAQANPKPCPVLAVSEPGDPRLPQLGEDLVSFALGCSFSFEHALLEDGIELRHMTCGCNVPMYRTNIPCQPAGPFAGPLVVSMRPLKPGDAIRAIQITSRFPAVHGAPVHIGLP